MIKPLRRGALVSSLVLLHRLIERLALSLQLSVPLSLATIHKIEYRMSAVDIDLHEAICKEAVLPCWLTSRLELFASFRARAVSRGVGFK